MIGDAGQGELSLAAGAVVSATGATIGVQAGSFGEVLVSGTGSLLTLAGGLNVGAAGAGVLSLALGGKVIATSVTIGATGAVNLLGGTLDPPSIFNGGVITGFGLIEGPLVNAGQLIASGGTLVVSGDVSGGGTLVLGAGGLQLDGAVAAGTTIAFTDGAGTLTVSTPASFGGAISGFAIGDNLSFLGVTDASYNTITHTLSITTESGTTTVPLVAASGAIHLGATGNGFQVAACFAEGTQLLTPEGRMPVEAIRPGQLLRTADGGIAPVIWAGRRRLDLRRHRRPQDVMPIRVREGAFAPGVPARDVRLSPDHAVFIDNMLVPVRYLTNGRTIVQERAASITYWHVELPRHGVVLAEGLPCESYLDTGNRSAFEDGGPALDLHPDFARAVWAAEGCAPLVTEGPPVIAARAALLARAASLGHGRTRDPALTVLCAGRALPLCVDGDLLLVSLPRGGERVRLRSRRFIPAESTAAETDTRRLGVAVAALWADGVEIALDDPRLASGWHDEEPEWRWTDGDAGLLLPGVRDLALRLAAPGTYWAANRPLHRRAAR
ncbi:MAG: Hint domain-containing protein [Alphaproteobacteria bacterium]|nr:Hint domain-containing protein [Alphaproteobacteria bacterium]